MAGDVATDGPKWTERETRIMAAACQSFKGDPQIDISKFASIIGLTEGSARNAWAAIRKKLNSNNTSLPSASTKPAPSTKTKANPQTQNQNKASRGGVGGGGGTKRSAAAMASGSNTTPRDEGDTDDQDDEDTAPPAKKTRRIPAPSRTPTKKNGAANGGAEADAEEQNGIHGDAPGTEDARGQTAGRKNVKVKNEPIDDDAVDREDLELDFDEV